jgi:hypothetical protein
MVDNGMKECISLRNLLECSKMADEVAMADKHLKETLKSENACKVLHSCRLLLVTGHMHAHQFGLSNPLDVDKKRLINDRCPSKQSTLAQY